MKAFIIYLPDQLHSVSHSLQMVDYLKSQNIDAELFEGTPGNAAVELARKSQKTLYPYSIKNRQLDAEEIKKLIDPSRYKEFKKKYHATIYEKQYIGADDIKKLSRPGVIGCFYSHYRLWEKCVELDEPIMIFEDDVKFYRGFKPVVWEDILILSLGKSSFLGEPWKSYLENPKGIPQAVEWKNFSMPGASGYAIKPNAAKGLVKFYKPYWYPADNAINKFVVKIQAATYMMGRNTLPDEGNVSMTKSKDWDQE